MPFIEASPYTSLVLDTNVFTHWKNQKEYALREIKLYFARLKKIPALSSMTIFESLYGVEKQLAKKEITNEQSVQSRLNIEIVSRNCNILSYNENAAAIAAYICANIGKSKYNQHLNDIFIAATALAHSHGVATQNKRDFELIANYLPGNQFLSLAVWKQ